MGKVDALSGKPLTNSYQILLFWGLVTFLMGVQTGLTPSDLSLLSRAVLLIYAWGSSVIAWVILHFSTLAVARFLVPDSWREKYPSYVLGACVLFAGCCIGTAISMAIRTFRADIYCYLASLIGDPCYTPAPLSLDWGSFGHFVRLALVYMPYWLTANYMVALLFSVDRYGFSLFRRRGGSADTQPVSPLLSRLPFDLGTDVIALEGKQHYVEVHTPKGSSLVLYRLSDAMKEMGERGHQIHRSYWVAYQAVDCIQKDKGTYRMVLSPTLSFPVSRAFQYVLKTEPFAKFM